MRHFWVIALFASAALLGSLFLTVQIAIASSLHVEHQQIETVQPEKYPAGDGVPLATPLLPTQHLGRLNPYTALGSDSSITETVTVTVRATITERMTTLAQHWDELSPYHQTTWLTYYGRPNIPVMGILGELEIADLIDALQEKSREYEQANGNDLSVTPAIHLVYGMATKAPGDDNSHLAFLDGALVTDYITMAAESNIKVILDVQIGALSPSESISRALPYLEYENVHLAIDPEFAMVHSGQYWPGDPIGYVTAEQVNDVQSVIQRYMRKHRIPGERVLLVHQFQSNMILNPEEIDQGYTQVAVTISVDGWGGPWAKISKYNSFITTDSPFAAFKLFYGWDEPILTPAQALGEEAMPDSDQFIDVTPNMIIYQ